MGSQPESKLSRKIMEALRARGVWCMKVHGGPMTMAGVPDILACVPVHCHPLDDPETTVGLFIGFETKTPSGGDPSQIQKFRHHEIRKAHGHVFVPRSVQDAVEALYAVGWRDPRESPSNVSTTT